MTQPYLFTEVFSSIIIHIILWKTAHALLLRILSKPCPPTVTNFLTFTITLSFGFTIFYGLLLESWINGRSILHYNFIFQCIMLQMCILYVFEMLTKHGITWLNYSHHFMACVGACVMYDFTKTKEEHYFYIIYSGFVMTDLFLYGSLFIYEAKRYMDPPSSLHNTLALWATRVSIFTQSVGITINIVLNIVFMILWWDHMNAIYKVLFIIADPIWIMEQCYVLHRSLLSAEKQLATLKQSKLTIVERCIKHATWWSNNLVKLKPSSKKSNTTSASTATSSSPPSPFPLPTPPPGCATPPPELQQLESSSDDSGDSGDLTLADNV